MKTVCKENKCVGCMACIDVCKKDAIRIKDTLSEYNAVINENKCVDCGMCKKICQNNILVETFEPEIWKQGWTKDSKIRNQGASGGVAMELAHTFVKNGGKVCSCTFDKGKFIFKIVDNENDLKIFAGSKYIKSNPSGIYEKIKIELKNGNSILFIGLPCQVAAVKIYVGKELEEKLIKVDLICHGTPSPKILDKFLKEYNKEIKNFKDIVFRVKGKSQVFDSSKTIVQEGCSDRYMISFLEALTYTENCYQCTYAKRQRVGDITLGDSWGSDLLESEWEKGISLILCQTIKGKRLLDAANVRTSDVDVDNAIKNNHQLEHPSIAPKGKDKFFKGLNQGKSFNKLVMKTLPKACYKQNMKSILIRTGIISRGGISYQIKIVERNS